MLYTVPCIRLSMLPAAFIQPVTKCLIGSHLGMVAFLLLLILSATETSAHGTTVEHDLHIVHNVDNRSKFFLFFFVIVIYLIYQENGRCSAQCQWSSCQTVMHLNALCSQFSFHCNHCHYIQYINTKATC